MKTLPQGTEPLKKGEAIEILPEWQDKGDADREWFVYEDEHDGRLGIFTPMPQMAFQPWQSVSAYMVRRVSKNQAPPCATPSEAVSFTPGPWHVQRTITGTAEAVEFVGETGSGEKKFNVFVESPAYNLAGVSGIGREECLANARLIASAPELLAACKNIADIASHDLLVSLEPESITAENLDEHLRNIRGIVLTISAVAQGAIRKATP